eukprot:3465392-Prymnesium_polylepis.1
MSPGLPVQLSQPLQRQPAESLRGDAVRRHVGHRIAVGRASNRVVHVEQQRVAPKVRQRVEDQVGHRVILAASGEAVAVAQALVPPIPDL